MRRFSIDTFIFYIVGLLVLTFGISSTIVSKLGASPFDSLLVGLYRTFGLTVGSYEFIVGAILVLFNAVAQRKLPDILAMGTAFLTGVGIDFWLYIFQIVGEPMTFVSQLFLLSIGIIFIGLGISIYLQAKFAPNPLDATMMVVHKLTGVKISTAKTVIMVIFLVFAYFFNGPIGIGTLIMVVASGPIIGLFYPYMEQLKKTTQKFSVRKKVHVDHVR